MGGLVAFLAAAPAMVLLAQARPPERRDVGSVVFVCEHGNVKSLIAKEWFDRLAAERSLAIRASSRGLTPGTAVAAPIAEKLRGDGFDVRDFHPRALTPEDLRGVSRVVFIGADPPAWALDAEVAIDRWDGIPPASERYEASRDAMKARIALLLESLGEARPTP